jgi:hypothetical protein
MASSRNANKNGQNINYDGTWLAGAEAFAFDPDLALVAGHQYPASDGANFGITGPPAPHVHAAA